MTDMAAPVKIAAFLAMLAVVFAASLWVGHALGPAPDAAVPATSEPHLHGGEHQ
ncbi:MULTISPECIES: hypothetical protein [Mycolicibacterium]|jgi:hypothetical protein|uniref:hypothetical protein n=1 Tax=Mycolicibacterium TaxID=1866885 RepID=UPI00130E2C96|nr:MULTISPECIES: hypothetical protein [Mycolicibacterium]QZY49353.1 hypothetical protein K5L12_00985 [Mycolicibacterium austroafricanum]UJL32132.1 hypothetical protein HZU38_27890 [Mycolicibacterium vanbaalenii]WND55285.1 hypothetical protein QQA43_21485 [Mycolicibacterium vanbaalenii]